MPGMKVFVNNFHEASCSNSVFIIVITGGKQLSDSEYQTMSCDAFARGILRVYGTGNKLTFGGKLDARLG